MTMSRTGGALVRRSRRAVIIGGSMSGLFSAAFLRQIGWDVDVYERSKVEQQPIYAGYYIWRGAPNESDLDAATLRTIYPLFTFYLPKQQQVITYPIAGFD